MQKTLLYLFILLLFGGGVYYFIFYKKEAAFAESEAGFQIRDTASIGTIFLSTPDGRRVLLNRTDSGWTLNKKYPALTQTVNILLETLLDQQALYPTPSSAHNRIITQLAGTGIKVELYDRKGEKMRVFYVGNEVHDYEGTTMLMEGADRSFVVSLGQFIGLLYSRYNPDIDNWRSKMLINVPEKDISKVAIEYPDAPLNSFTVNNDNGKISVTADPGIIGTHQMNERRVKLFLGFFENLVCEGHLNGMKGLDSIISTVPKKCAIDLVTKQGLHQHLDIYWMPQTQRSKNIDTTRNLDIPKGYDIDRYYAVGNNFKDTLLIQQYTFDKVFRKAYEFYQEDPTVDVVGFEKKEK